MNINIGYAVILAFNNFHLGGQTRSNRGVGTFLRIVKMNYQHLDLCRAGRRGVGGESSLMNTPSPPAPAQSLPINLCNLPGGNLIFRPPGLNGHCLLKG